MTAVIKKLGAIVSQEAQLRDSSNLESGSCARSNSIEDPPGSILDILDWSRGSEATNFKNDVGPVLTPL